MLICVARRWNVDKTMMNCCWLLCHSSSSSHWRRIPAADLWSSWNICGFNCRTILCFTEFRGLPVLFYRRHQTFVRMNNSNSCLSFLPADLVCCRRRRRLSLYTTLSHRLYFGDRLPSWCFVLAIIYEDCLLLNVVTINWFVLSAVVVETWIIERWWAAADWCYRRLQYPLLTLFIVKRMRLETAVFYSASPNINIRRLPYGYRHHQYIFSHVAFFAVALLTCDALDD